MSHLPNNSERFISIDIMIGTTRKCNLACSHCLRGDSEKIDFNIQTFIDLLLKNPELETHGINNLDFTGGEPFLNLDAITEVISICKHRKIAVNSFSITTNGTKWTPEVMDVLATLLNFVELPENCTVRVSDSPFHRDELKKKNLSRMYNLESILQHLYEDFEYELGIHDLELFSDRTIYLDNQDDIVLLDLGRATDLNVKKRHDYNYSYSTDDTLFLYLTEEGIVVPNVCDIDYDGVSKVGIVPLEFDIFQYHASQFPETV